MQSKAEVPHWALVSCLGPETRSLSVHAVLKARDALACYRYLDIKNPVYEYSQVFEANKEAIRQKFFALGGDQTSIKGMHLIDSTHFDIVDFVQRDIAGLGESIILDISTMPKRFFFPILRKLIESLRGGTLKNLAVCYSIPERYTKDRLAWNHDEWGSLPLYHGRYTRRKTEKIVISIGFETLGLIPQLENEKGASGAAVLLLPFPSTLGWTIRCWDTVERIVRAWGNEWKVVCCDSRDVSQAFDQMESISNFGTREILLAPYGPKPLSLAVALFAAKYDYPVFYTQPRHYHPEYSTGVEKVENMPMCIGYLLGIDGRYLYA